MRFGVALAAVAAATVSVSAADAATIIQITGNQTVYPGIFAPFNPTTGTLNKVTVDVSAREDRTIYASFTGPPANGSNYSIGYDLAGQVAIFLRTPSAGTAGKEVARLDIAAKGSQAFASSGYLDFSGLGSNSFALDPALFISTAAAFQIYGRDEGYLNGSFDTTFTTADPVTFVRQPGRCSGFRQGDEACNYVGFRITYDYTPAAVTPTPAVPEPATWAMMILGMAGVGAAMRRRSAKLAFA